MASEHDEADELFWSQSTGGGYVEGAPDPSDPRLNNTMSPAAYFSEFLDPSAEGRP